MRSTSFGRIFLTIVSVLDTNEARPYPKGGTGRGGSTGHSGVRQGVNYIY